jgi:AraC-like DNA-binding protein/mannose-6-phosphate isomerase-like protein (cupin superfamily)
MTLPNNRYIAEFMLPDMDSTFRIFASHVRTVNQDWSYPRHTHPLFEVNLLLAGEQEIIVNSQRYFQQPGDLLLLRPEDVHESRAIGKDPMTYYCLHFNVDDPVLHSLLSRRNFDLYVAASLLSRTIRPSLDKLISLTSSNEVPVKLANKMRAMSAVFDLLAGLSEVLSEQGEEGLASSKMGRVAFEIAARLEKSVEDSEAAADPQSSGNYDVEERHSRDTVAAATADLGYSTSSCNRIFHRVYGISPRQYLSGLKLKKAKLLLMESELSVEEVSARLGYKDIAHFSRQFKRWTGESPGKFRARFHV